MKFNIIILSFLLSLAIPTFAQNQPTNIITGPMIGQIQPTKAVIWLHAQKPTDFRIRFRPIKNNAFWIGAFGSTQPEKNNSTKITLNLPYPNTEYEYQIYAQTKNAKMLSGTFKSPPNTNKPTTFKLAITSGMKHLDDQSSWITLQNQKPDLHLIIGNSIYPKKSDTNTIWQHHLKYRQSKQFAKVLKNIPTYAVWDSNDFGPKLADTNFKGKQKALSTFTQIFANPYAGTTKTPGLFHTFDYGDIQFFMLDTRYHRTSSKIKNKRILGDDQFNWLISELKKSKAKFKIIAMGSALKANKKDGWALYRSQRKKLFHQIMTNKISGVIFISGNTKTSDIQTHRTPNGYKLTEVISSGITRSKQKSFATIQFDTNKNNPTATIKLHFANKRLNQETTLILSDLKF